MENETYSEKQVHKRDTAPIIIISILIIAVVASALFLFIFAKPEIVLNGEQHVKIEYGSEFSDPGAKAVLRGKDISNQLSSKGDVDVNKIGDYEITYSLKYLIKTFQKTRTVTVVDTTAPVLTLSGTPTVTIALGTEFTEPGYTALDGYDGDISSKVTVTGEVNTAAEGDYILTYKSTDSSGNTAEAERTVSVKKNSVPESDKNTIFLTFDDGPSSNLTPQNLDILKKNGIHATFYILNYSDDQLPIIKRQLAEGHTIGIHGYSHDYAKIYTSPDVAMDNFIKLKDKLYNDTGYSAFTFRFPGGSSNTISRHYCKGIMTTLAGMVEAAGYSYMDWNISSGDASGVPLTADAIAANVISGLRHDRANIVLMHDSAPKTSTTAALQQIIDYGKANGYNFASIYEGMPPMHHNINN